jgi:hypothetical protein
MLSRPSIASGSFLREIVMVTWHATDRRPDGIDALTEEANVARDRLFFGLSRRHDWAKDLRWTLQKRVELGMGDARVMTRNNAMRPPLAPIEFLDYRSPTDTDILQEFFIPEDAFVPFLDEFRRILLEHDANVISFTVRHVRANGEAVLSYAPERDAFAVIHMSNIGLDDESQARYRRMTRELVDAAIRHGGTHYLTYQTWPTREQLRAAYPNADLFFTKKLGYDPEEMFVSRFYEVYAPR